MLDPELGLWVWAGACARAYADEMARTVMELGAMQADAGGLKTRVADNDRRLQAFGGAFLRRLEALEATAARQRAVAESRKVRAALRARLPAAAAGCPTQRQAVGRGGWTWRPKFCFVCACCAPRAQAIAVALALLRRIAEAGALVRSDQLHKAYVALEQIHAQPAFRAWQQATLDAARCGPAAAALPCLATDSLLIA